MKILKNVKKKLKHRLIGLNDFHFFYRNIIFRFEKIKKI